MGDRFTIGQVICESRTEMGRLGDFDASDDSVRIDSINQGVVMAGCSAKSPARFDSHFILGKRLNGREG